MLRDNIPSSDSNIPNQIADRRWQREIQKRAQQHENFDACHELDSWWRSKLLISGVSRCCCKREKKPIVQSENRHKPVIQCNWMQCLMQLASVWLEKEASRVEHQSVSTHHVAGARMQDWNLWQWVDRHNMSTLSRGQSLLGCTIWNPNAPLAVFTHQGYLSKHLDWTLSRMKICSAPGWPNLSAIHFGTFHLKLPLSSFAKFTDVVADAKSWDTADLFCLCNSFQLISLAI